MGRQIINETVFHVWKEIDPEKWPNLVEEIIVTFFEVAPVQYEKLIWAQKNGDLPSVRFSAHMLKSSFGNVGAEEAHYLLDQIERFAEMDEKENLAPCFHHLDKVVSESIDALRTYRKSYMTRLDS